MATIVQVNKVQTNRSGAVTDATTNITAALGPASGLGSNTRITVDNASLNTGTGADDLALNGTGANALVREGTGATAVVREGTGATGVVREGSASTAVARVGTSGTDSILRENSALTAFPNGLQNVVTAVTVEGGANDAFNAANGTLTLRQAQAVNLANVHTFTTTTRRNQNIEGSNTTPSTITWNVGDIAIVTASDSTRGTYVYDGDVNNDDHTGTTADGDWTLLVAPTDAVTSVNSRTGVVTGLAEASDLPTFQDDDAQTTNRTLGAITFSNNGATMNLINEDATQSRAVSLGGATWTLNNDATPDPLTNISYVETTNALMINGTTVSTGGNNVASFQSRTRTYTTETSISSLGIGDFTSTTLSPLTAFPADGTFQIYAGGMLLTGADYTLNGPRTTVTFNPAIVTTGATSSNTFIIELVTITGSSVTQVARPSIFRTKSADQAISGAANNALTEITFDSGFMTSNADVGGASNNFTLSSGNPVAPTTGIYSMAYNIRVDGADSGGVYTAGIDLGGSGQVGTQVEIVSPGTTVNLKWSGLVEVTAGQEISLSMRAQTDGTYTVHAQTDLTAFKLN